MSLATIGGRRGRAYPPSALDPPPPKNQFAISVKPNNAQATKALSPAVKREAEEDWGREKTAIAGGLKNDAAERWIVPASASVNYGISI